MSGERDNTIHHIFLSYGRHDATELVERLGADLEAAGFQVWRDTGEIRSGRWEEQIEAAIRQSDAVVAVLSPHSTRSDSVCLDEISFARYASPPRPIFPIMIAPCTLPLPICRLHYVDLCGWRAADVIYTAGLAKLIDSLRSTRAPQHAMPTAAWSLPRPLTRFVGRAHELVTLAALLTEPDVPLVTIAGIGGIGKTRLALALAEEAGPRFEDGICFVSAESMGEGGELFTTLARALQMEIRPTPDVREQVVHFLASRAMLLILDGVEEISRAVNDITELAKRAPGLRILATSRRLLGIPGEHSFMVPSLDAPKVAASCEQALAYPAVALFCERARASSSFQLSEANLEAVTAICRHLDGHPLSIELAAACTRGMSAREIQAGLADRFSLLVSRSGGAPPRQRALRDVIEWACNMLAPDVQRFFASLGIFRGGFSLSAVQAIFTDEGALDSLFQLLDHALVTAHVQGEWTRYDSPESVAEYSRHLLRGLELNELREAHARYYIEQLESAVTHLHQADEAATLRALERDLDNCRAALKWAGEVNHPLLARGAAAGSRMLVAFRLWPEALELARVAVEAAHEPRLQWTAWFALADALVSLGRHDEALAAAVESGARAEDPTLEGRSLNLEGVILQLLGRHADARERYQRALERLKAADEARVLHNVAFLDFVEGDVASAEKRYREVVALRRRYHDQSGLAETLNNLGDLLRARDHLDEARACYEESARLWHDLGDRHGCAISHHNLGELLFLQGRPAEAQAQLGEALAIFEALGSPYAEESRALLGRVSAPA